MSSLLLFLSCNEHYNYNDIESIEKHTIKKTLNLDDLSKAKRLIESLIIKNRDELSKKNDTSIFDKYSKWSDELGSNITLDSRLEDRMNNDYNENINFLINNGLISIQEKNAIENLKNNLNSNLSFNSSINNFISELNILNLNTEKVENYINFVNSLIIVDHLEPQYFNANTGSRSTLFGSCLSASIGLGIAFVGLATLEVGSAGLATGVAAAGFIWASGEWGAACK
ncbi:hypothetical protein [Tenacibaculum maritimum]|uniref:hypothetical protein n=3 Tax=Tenacibaculum maritimum TaxID=107401 RepID=UPI0038776D9C